MIALLLWNLGVLALAFSAACVAWWIRGLRDARQLDSLELLIAHMPQDVGVAIVSTGSPHGDKLWKWSGEHMQGRFLQASPSFARMLGRESVVGHTFADLTADGLDDDLASFDAVLAGASDGYAMEKAYRLPDGSHLPAGLTVIVPGFSAGERPDWVMAVVVSRERERRREDEVSRLRKRLRGTPTMTGMRALLETMR